MATRDLTVRLRADVEGYRRAMAQAAKATGDLERQGMAVQRAGRAMSSFGSELTRSVTVPILAVGAAATKMAMDFDQTFAQMRGLAGVSADEVDRLKESVLGLAGETGRAPQELAEALYFIRSSGIDGQAALEALEVSAKAAASGLGSTQVVADAVTSAMNAYADSGMTAARATDVLVATAREGKAEPAELASQMGRLLPVASQLGISFEDVGAAVATLSLNGNDAATSATQLTNVMSKLLKPSQQGAAALEAVGLSIEDVQAMLTEKGLLGTLEELKARLGDAGFVRFLEDQQAVQGGLALLGGDLDATRARFDALHDSAGASADAFKQTDSDARKVQQAWAEVQAVLIQVGGIIAPVAADLARLASSAAQAFGSLPEPVQRLIVAFAGLVASIGPAVWLGGKAVTIYGQLLPVFGKISAASNTAALALDKYTASGAGFSAGLSKVGTGARIAAGALGLGALVLAAKEVGDAYDRINFGAVADALNSTSTSARGSTEELIRASVAMGRLDSTFSGLLNTSVPAAEAFLAQARAMGVQEDQLDSLKAALEEKKAADVGGQAASAAYSSEVSQGADALSGQADAARDAAAAVQSYADALRAQFDPLFAVASANDALAQANQAVNDAVAEYGENSPEAVQAHLAAAEAAARQQGALGDLATAVRDGTVSVEDATSTLNDWVARGIISRATANATAAAFRGYASAANSVPDAVTTRVTADTSGARTKILQVRDALGQVRSKTITIGVTTALGGQAVALMNNKMFRAAGGPVSAKTPYIVGEKGPEWFVPETDGTIYPNGTPLPAHATGHMTPVAAAGAGAGGVTYITNVTANVTGPDPDATVRAIKRWEQRNGPVMLRRG